MTHAEEDEADAQAFERRAAQEHREHIIDEAFAALKVALVFAAGWRAGYRDGWSAGTDNRLCNAMFGDDSPMMKLMLGDKT